MRNLTISIFMLLGFLSGCTTTSQVQDNLISYVGMNSDSFFMRYGMPAARFQFQNKNVVYRWSSGVTNMQMPAFTSQSGNINSMGTFSGGGSTFGGGNAQFECIIDITVNEQNIINSLRIVKDTIGLWAISRCAEVLRM